MVGQIKIVWSKTAQIALEKHCYYIKEESALSAEKVKTAVLRITKSLAKAPTRYPLDKYRKNNKGDIRAFEKYNVRVAYQVKENEIIILRVRHTKRSPLDY